jgi:UDP-GlcNAc:undecaprenyl-phosphate GlcNAc-1-phosphate transferase
VNRLVAWLLVCGAAAAVSCTIARLLVVLAPRLGFVDHPTTCKAHTTPTPLMGGVAVYLGALAGVMIDLLVGSDFSCIPAVFLPATLAAIGLGLLDDYLVLTPWPKLVGLLVCAAIPASAGTLSGTWSVPTAALIGIAALLSVNSFNLLDNCDGLCASVGAVGLAGIALLRGSVMSGAGAAALLGFLVWNRPRARIFLGDAGSLLVGMWCALCAFAPSPATGRLFVWQLLPVFIVPACDTAFVISVRLIEGRSVMQGGQDHVSHRLVRAGLPVAAVDILLSGVTALGVLASWWLMG